MRKKSSKRSKYDEARKAGFDSPLEKRVTEDLIARGLVLGADFKYHPYEIEWKDTGIRNAACSSCGSTKVHKTRSYEPDLRIVANRRLIEVKGRLTADDRKTLIGARAMLKDGQTISILFQRDNPLSPKWPRYSYWAKWAKFEYAIGERIPDEWLA